MEYQPPYTRPPSSGPPPLGDPYNQHYQHQTRPPGPAPTHPNGHSWYTNQFHNPHTPSPAPQPPPQWRPPPHHLSSSAYPTQSHQPQFNGNNQFVGPPRPPPYPHANQEWGNQNWGQQQGNSNVNDWAVKAREWAADQHSQSVPNPPGVQVYQQYHSQSQDVHQQAVPGSSVQQFIVPHTTQPERYPNYATGNESYLGGSSTEFSHQENMPPTSSIIHQQEVPYCYSSVAGKIESGNATQHEVQISLPNGGGPVHTEQQMQYAYGDRTATPPSDYANLHNAWPPYAPTGVVYPPIHSSVSSMPQHESTMPMSAVSSQTMPPFGSFTPANLQPVGPPYAFATEPTLHPVTTFMEESYASSSVPPKKAPVPNWLKEELLKKKASLERPSSASFEERESVDDHLLYKIDVIVDQHVEKRFSPSKSSDDEEGEEDVEEEMDEAINMEIKRVLTEVLLKVTDELFDEIATKIISEDEAIPKADPMDKASAKILVSVGGSNEKASSGAAADLLGLGSYASDDDTDVASNADDDGSEGAKSLSIGSKSNGTEKLPEPKSMVNARLDPEVEAGDNSKSDLDQMLSSKKNDAEGGSSVNLDTSASVGVDDYTSESKRSNADRTYNGKDAILDEPDRKNSDCVLSEDGSKHNGKECSDDVSKDRSITDETKTGKDKVEKDSQSGSNDRLKQNNRKSVEKVKGLESNKRSRDEERSRRTDSKEERSTKKREREKEEDRSRNRKAEESRKDKRRQSPTSDESSDDSIRKSRSRRRNVSPSPVRSRRKYSSPSSDESSDDSRRKSSSRRRKRSPSPERSRRRHVSSPSSHSKHSQRKHSTSLSSHEKSRSKRSRSRSPRRRHRS